MRAKAETIVGSELAELFGISVAAVRSHADAGHIVRAGIRGRYLRDESIRKYCAHLRGMAAGRGGEIQSNLAQERARLAREQADERAMRNAVSRGEMVAASDVLARWRATLIVLRSRLLAVPSRVGARAPHLTRLEVEIVATEVRAALEELANQ